MAGTQWSESSLLCTLS